MRCDVCCVLYLRYTDQSGEEEEDYESEEQIQHRILTAALEFVPDHGWTAEAIAEGAQVGRDEGGTADPNECRVRLQRASCFLSCTAQDCLGFLFLSLFPIG